MIIIGILTGIYSHILFFLGIIGLLSKENILGVSVLFLFLFFFLSFKNLISMTRNVIAAKTFYKDKAVLLFLFLLLLMAVVNFVGALGPELSFDALWYHLTLPKIFLSQEKMLFIPGGLLYYSLMPKLGEMIFLGGLSVGSEEFVKIIHFTFGLLVLSVTYFFSRVFVSRKLALLTTVIFYSNLVVAWESTTAYVDLIWAFYEIGSIYYLFVFFKEKKMAFLYVSALFLGLALSVKLVAVLSIIVSLGILLFMYRTKKQAIDLSIFAKYLVLALIIPIPWLVFSFLHTGKPVYPFFTNIYPVLSSYSFFSLPTQSSFFKTFLFSPDPISPLYLIALPLIFYLHKTFKTEEKLLLFSALLSLVAFYFTPRSGGARFLIPFLPIFSIIVVVVLQKLQNMKNTSGKILAHTIIICSVLSMFISIVYRGVANAKYVPVILHKETKENFLGHNLNFAFGDFYDTDNFFTKYLSSSDMVLLYGFHNLYYIMFPFIDETWVKKGDTFNYVATQKAQLPARFSSFKKVHENKRTHVTVYKSPTPLWTY